MIWWIKKEMKLEIMNLISYSWKWETNDINESH